MLAGVRKFRLEAVSFVAGMVVMTFELAASRIVAPYIGTTIYTWTSVIGGILAGLALGYYLGGYLADKRMSKDDITLLLSAGALVIFSVNLYKDWFLYHLSRLSIDLQLTALLAAVSLFLAPTILLGAVTPYLARLSLDGMKTSGRHFARINAAGTIGSLAGTFMTGYFLFGFIGTRNILNLLAIILLLASLLMRGPFVAIRLAAIALIAVAAHSPPKAHLFGLVDDLDSNYSRIQVFDELVDGKWARVYQTDALGYESGTYLYETGLAFDYIRSLSYAARLAPADGNYLVIGGGAFTLPSYLAERRPQAGIDVVEIDGKLKQVAGEYFGFQYRGNLHLIDSGGRQFLNHNSKKYDYIAVDAFSSIAPPFQLTTKEAASRIKASLAPSGIAAVNLVSAVKGPRSYFGQSEYQTYKQLFGQVSIFQVKPGYDPYKLQNLLLLAGRRPLDLGTLKRSGGGPEAAAIFGKPAAMDDAKGIILTDDFAPVERYVAGGI